MKILIDSIVFPLHLILVSSLTFFWGNRDQVAFLWKDVAPYALVVFFVAVMLLWMLLFSFRNKLKVYSVLAGVFSGLAFCVWLQSQILLWNFGPLDGRGINWFLWTKYAIFEVVLWVTIIPLVIFGFIRRLPIFLNLPGFLLVLAAISSATAYLGAPKSNHETVESSGSVFKFHPDNNVVVILLDTFQSDYFEMISKDFPSEVGYLKDFTFYRNAMSSYPTTAPNLPAIFTGENYKNQVPFKRYIREEYSKSNLNDSFVSSGYISNVVGIESISSIVPSATPMWSYLRYGGNYKFESAIQFFDYGFFRAVPTFFKRHIYSDGDWFLSGILKGDYPPDYHGTDIKFMHAFVEKADVDASINQKGKFTFMHFAIPHAPWRVNEHLQYDISLKGSEGYIRQVRGALLLTKNLIDKLQSLGIYDNSEIFIMSDHGTMSVPPLRRSMGEGGYGDAPSSTHSSALGLLLHKKPYSNFTNILVDDTPLYLRDLSCLFTKVDFSSSFDCSDVVSAFSSKKRQRIFYAYDWKHEYWGKEYMPPMTEYLVNGHVYDLSAWSRGNWFYHEGKKEALTGYAVDIRGAIIFNNAGYSQKLVRFGWSGQEPTHRWTEGPKAAVQFRIQDFAERDLVLRLNANGYLGGGLPHQKVGVVVNGAQVAEWQVAGVAEYTAVIPANLVGDDGLINISFDISDPRAPCDYSESTDCRKLGLAVRELVVDYVQ